MASEVTKQRTRDEWRELGFFYDRDDHSREWRVVGSRKGFHKFAELLRAYARNPRNAGMSEHDHYGPYMYLKIMTWPEQGMDANVIFGPVEKLAELADIVEREIVSAEPGEIRCIRDQFSSKAEYKLVLELRAEEFDPASADMSISSEAG